MAQPSGYAAGVPDNVARPGKGAQVPTRVVVRAFGLNGEVDVPVWRATWTPKPAPQLASQARRKCFRQGALVAKDGRRASDEDGVPPPLVLFCYAACAVRALLPDDQQGRGQIHVV